MKKTLNNIFDEANANEIENLVNKNAASDVSADTLCSIKNKVYAKTGIENTKKKKSFIFRWQSYVAAAACLCLVVGVMFGTGVFRFPSAQPNEIVEPDIEYYQLNDLLNRDDFSNIIWGTLGEDNSSSDEDPNQSGGGNNCVPVPDDEIWVEWNGIKISTALQSAFIQLKTDDLIAIGIDSWADPALIYDDYVELDDYVFNGKTYYEIRTGYAKAQELYQALVDLKKISGFYDELKSEENEYFWNKLYDTVEEEIVSRYFQGDKKNGKFDTTAISNDLNASETEMLQLENDMAACRREYNAKFDTVPELSQMMNKGYYVVGNKGAFAVILSVGQLPQFSEDVKAVYGAEVIDNVMFRLATKSELGVEEPTDEEPPIVPGGIVDDITLPDDVIDEPAVEG